jgi:hypothetical protein
MKNMAAWNRKAVEGCNPLAAGAAAHGCRVQRQQRHPQQQRALKRGAAAPAVIDTHTAA